jgi:hypothetical protein
MTTARGGDVSQREVELDQGDKDLLLRAVRRTYQERPDAVSLLRRIGFPEDDIPPFRNINDDWQSVFDRLDRGVLEAGYRALVCAFLKDFPWNTVVGPLAERLRIDCAGGPPRNGWAESVLVVGANPDGASMIRADREMRGIRTAAKPLGVLVDVLTAAAFLDLLEIVDQQPDVLHVICHSDGTHLEFAAPGSELAEIVAAQRVVDLLAAFRDQHGVRLHAVVLNCCQGEGFAERFLHVADVVVAHRGDLDDECAVGFARALYRQARTGSDIGAAAHVAATMAATPPFCEMLPTDLVVLRRTG